MAVAVQTSAPAPRGARRGKEAVGLTLLLLAGFVIFVIGAGWLTGPLAALAVVVLLAFVVALVTLAFVGDQRARRALAPYGLLGPGTLFLCLFYLAHVLD